jgi:hypothetical protein
MFVSAAEANRRASCDSPDATIRGMVWWKHAGYNGWYFVEDAIMRQIDNCLYETFFIVVLVHSSCTRHN